MRNSINAIKLHKNDASFTLKSFHWACFSSSELQGQGSKNLTFHGLWYPPRPRTPFLERTKWTGFSWFPLLEQGSSVSSISAFLPNPTGVSFMSDSDLQSLSRQSCMDARFAILPAENSGYFGKNKAFFLQIPFLESYDFKKTEKKGPQVMIVRWKQLPRKTQAKKELIFLNSYEHLSRESSCDNRNLGLT